MCIFKHWLCVQLSSANPTVWKSRPLVDLVLLAVIYRTACSLEKTGKHAHALTQQAHVAYFSDHNPWWITISSIVVAYLHFIVCDVLQLETKKKKLIAFALITAAARGMAKKDCIYIHSLPTPAMPYWSSYCRGWRTTKYIKKNVNVMFKVAVACKRKPYMYVSLIPIS